MIDVATALLELMRTKNMSLGQAIIKDDAGIPKAAVIIVIGQPETDDVLDAIQDVEKYWVKGEA